MYKHILISTDGSDLALKGVEHGLALAKETGSKVTVVTVSHPYPPHTAAPLESWTSAQRQFAESALMSAKAIAERLGVEIAVRQDTNSSAAEAIIKAVDVLECDLIVMASHGRRGVRRLLLGSQTAEVVTYSKVPVLVVR